jgi:lysophospholipase L1-like esterase
LSALGLGIPVVLAGLLCALPVHARDEDRGPLVLLIGDSTAQGVCRDCPPPPAMSPAGALEMLRERLPVASRWRRLRALSAGVGGSTSGDWVKVRPAVCSFVAKAGERPADIGLRVLERACAQGGGLTGAARDILGERPAIALVVLGANDVMNAVTPAEYVANLRAIIADLAPVPVLVATPFYSPQAERSGLAAYAEAVRAGGLLGGPDFYAIHLPVDGSLVHLTAGGYAAAAALWLDKLPP